MIIHRLAVMFCAVILIQGSSTLAWSSALRLTPAVRAIKPARPAVVNIHSQKSASNADSLFGVARNRKVNGMGTGIIVDERGYIVTNYHVVSGVDSLRVTLFDGSTFSARVVSFDRKHDLSVIKINATRKLPVMVLGTSSDLMLAETVFAVGNAYGYEDTVTSGIVSALSRNVEVNEKQSYKNLIQTDASINPGNSGGPLINLDGEVVGINVAIRAGAQRIGFAIPIDDARQIIAQLMSVEKLNQTFHGLLSRDVKSADLKELRVQGAKPGSPAAKSGFQPGDVVTRVDAKGVLDRADFERALLGRAAGDSIDVHIRRGMESLKLSLQMVASQSATLAPVTVQRNTLSRRSWRALGLRLKSIPASQSAVTGRAYRGGMQVVDVRPSSPAALTGIQQGDILVGLHEWETINDENVAFVLEHRELRTFNPLKFYVVRGTETLYGHMKLAIDAQ